MCCIQQSKCKDCSNPFLVKWEELKSSELLDELVNEKSFQSPIAIFKHSTRCAISALAKSRLQSSWDKHNSDIPIFLLDLIRYRELSNQIEKSLGVKHESPQLIVLEKGEIMHHSSHLSIAADRITESRA